MEYYSFKKSQTVLTQLSSKPKEIIHNSRGPVKTYECSYARLRIKNSYIKPTDTATFLYIDRNNNLAEFFIHVRTRETYKQVNIYPQ